MTLNRQFFYSIVFVYISCFGFSAHGQELSNYGCITHYTNLEGFFSEPPGDSTFSVSPEGIFLKNGSTHPVRIAMLGIACYQEFLVTNDSVYFKRMQNQLHYFRDSSYWDFAFDGKGIGLPYSTDYHDLKAPWYSGMAQGLALSFLLRNRELTGDTSLDQTMHKIAYFMVQPEEQGGTLSMHDTEPWIELYPNSAVAKHVLNGSINGFIGLYEYCKVFPGNTRLETLRDRCYEVYRDRLPLFTNTGWSRYDLSGNFCNPLYLRYQIYEMLQLFQLLNDDLFRRQALLWSALLGGKVYDNGINTHKNIYFDISRKVTPGPGGWQVPVYDSLAQPASIKKLTVFDELNELKEYLQIPQDTTYKNGEHRFIIIDLDNATSFQYLKMPFESRAHELSISLYYKSGNSLKELKTIGHQLSDQFWHAQTISDHPEKKYDQIIIKFEGKGAVTTKYPQPVLIDTTALKLPWFGHYQTLGIPMEAGKIYQFTLENYQVKYLRVFYKGAAELNQLDDANYLPTIFLENAQFIPAKTGYYQFMICYELENLVSIVDMLRYSVLNR